MQDADPVDVGGCGAVGLTRAGERVAVRIAFSLRRPCPAQAAALQPLWVAALRLSVIPAGYVDLYVQPAGRLNAYAAGGRSVAVTTWVLEDYRAGRLSEAQIVAVLVHEPMLIAMRFAAPWRVAAGLLTGLAGALFGRPAQRTLRITVFFGVAVAVVRDLQRGILDGRGVLVALALSAVICQVADAAVSRRAQFAADLFAADRGLAIELARALRALHGPSNPTYGWSRRLHRTHPTPENRISALLTVRVDSKRRISCRSGAATRRPAAA